MKRLRPLIWRVLGSSIGEKTFILPGARITKSTIGRGCNIGVATEISESKLGDNVNVETGARVSRASLGNWTTLQPMSEIGGSELGSYSYLGRRVLMSSTRVGRFCSIGPNVVCGAGEHPTQWLSTSPVFFSPYKQCGCSFGDDQRFEESRKVSIGNDVWIGANAVIRNGVNIGHGAIVGALACVVKDVAPYSIVGGVPGRVIRLRFPKEIVERLLKVSWWDFSEPILRENAWRWNSEDIEEFITWAETIKPGSPP